MMTTATSTASTAFVSNFLRFLITFFLLAFTVETNAAQLNDWRSRSVYQILTDRFARTDGSTTAPCILDDKKYCGGTWQGIINKLDYIQGMGFTAIWISPVVKNIDGSAEGGEPYHGFWSQNIYELNSHFGTADDLKALSKAVHDRDMLLMIDVVANNLAYAGPGNQTVFSAYTPFNDEKYFHSYCPINNWDNVTEVHDCWLGNDVVSLPDLNTELDSVKSIWDGWAKGIITNYTIDGMRIDAAKHVDKPFWTQFQTAADLYTVGEVFDDSISENCDYMSDALSGVLNYPMFYTINSTFMTYPPPNMTLLQGNFSDIQHGCQDTTLMGTFTENHDQSRLANFSADTSLLKNALSFAFATDGIPIVYYGAEQEFVGAFDPYNREALWGSEYKTDAPLYTHIATLNAARNAIAKAATYTYWSPYWTWKSKFITAKTEVVAVRKGYDHSIVSVMTNQGAQIPSLGPYTIGDTNFLEGDTILDVLSCETQVAQAYGVIKSTVKNGAPQAWVTASLMNGTNICPSVDKSPSVKAKKGGTIQEAALSRTLLMLATIGALVYSL